MWKKYKYTTYNMDHSTQKILIITVIATISKNNGSALTGTLTHPDSKTYSEEILYEISSQKKIAAILFIGGQGVGTIQYIYEKKGEISVIPG